MEQYPLIHEDCPGCNALLIWGTPMLPLLSVIKREKERGRNAVFCDLYPKKGSVCPECGISIDEIFNKGGRG